MSFRSPSRGGAVLLGLLVPLLGALGGGGCTAVGFAAAGPLFSAVQMVGDRTVERTLAADLPTTWAATADALARMGILAREADRSGETWLLTGTGGAVTVHGELAPVTPRMTRLLLRVEAGRLVADKRTAEEIHSQVASSLAQALAPARPEPRSDQLPQKEALTTLQEEIRRLSSKIEESRKASHVPTAGQPGVTQPALTTLPGVIQIPSAYGVPSLPPRIQETVERGSAPPGAVEAGRSPEPASSLDPTRGSVLPVPLSPVGVLTPVQSLTGSRSSQ
jgi:hypothetical protein